MSESRMSDAPPPVAPVAHRHRWRIALLALLGIVVIVVAAGSIFVASFDPNSLKPRIVETVRRATGRELSLNGKLSLLLSLQPTIEARDIALSNPPGFSRPQLATVDRLQLQFGLLPLLSGRIEIDRLVLIHPDIRLETDASGQPNWQLTPQNPPPAETPQQAAKPQPKSAGTTAVSISAIGIQDGTLAYRDGRTATTRSLGLSRLEATAAGPDAPLHVETEATFNATTFNLIADTGGLTRLQDKAATTPWPVKWQLTAAGANLTAVGTLTQPLLGKGYDLAISGAVPDVAALAPLFPGQQLPPLHDVNFAAKLADRGAAWPEVNGLTLHVGASDLDAQLPGLLLTQLDIVGSALDQPTKVAATARLNTMPLALNATLGAPSLLLPDVKPQPFPIDATVQAGGATGTAKGSVANVRALTGVNLALAAQIPDLAALSPLARTPLPALKSVTFQSTLTDAGNSGLRNGIALHGLRLRSSAADLTGDGTIGLAPRRSLTAALTSSHLDLDALQAATDQTAAPPAAPPTAPPPAAAPPPRRSDRLFSDQPLPFDQLRGADGDLRLTIAVLRSGGADYKQIDTHATLTNGKLVVDHLTAELLQGRLDGKISADANQPNPPVHVALHASGVALKSILALAHEPSYASGNVELYADLSGTGASPHALAGSLDGSLGVAMAGGTIDNRLLGSVLGRVLEQLNALNLVGRGGTSELRCFGLRLDAQHGVGTIRALALSSALLTLTGSGTLNLGEETLDMTLRPEARIAGTPVVVPIQLRGPIRSPATSINKLGTAESNVGSVAGAVIGNATPLGIIGGLFGVDKLLTGGGGDICTPALAAARGGTVPPATPPATTGKPGKPADPILSNPGAALRNLFR